MALSGDRIVRLIADPGNRAILTILNDAAEPLSVIELAERLSTHEEVTASGPDQETLAIRLHHDCLPKLDEAGLVDYNRNENVVKYKNYPQVDAEWQDIEFIDELLSCFSASTEIKEDAIGLIEGRQDVIEYGRYLADEAEEELFCIYTSTDLLEEECIQHAEAARDRGVNLILGSKNPEVRELALDRLPETTLWEPQLDWMNTPTQRPKIGRFILTDREKVMLAILKDTDGDNSSLETAIVGEGRDNPLVVLVRELLGPRLDHLDYQSEDFLDELPFEP